MISREDLELLLQTQRESYKDALTVVTQAFESRISNLESSLGEAKIEISRLKSISSLQEKIIENLKNPITNYRADQEAATLRIDSLEDHSRRNNLRFEGLPENDQENWEQSENKVRKLLKEKLGFEDSLQIERAHRIGKPQFGKVRPIVAKFLRFSDRSVILRNSNKLKGSNIYINEDLCENSLEIRRGKLPELKLARSQGKIAYFVHTKLVIKDRLVTTTYKPQTAIPQDSPPILPVKQSSVNSGMKTRRATKNN